MRLQREAQRLCDRVSALGMDQNLLAKSFAALTLGAVDNTASSPTPPNIIDLQQLEAAIHRRQQEENEQLKQLQQQQQQAAVESVPPSPSSPIQEKEGIQFEDETGKLTKAALTSQKKQALRKDKTINVDQPPKSPPENELPTTATTMAKKKKKKSKSSVVGADVEKAVEEKETMTIAAGTSLESESDWIVVPSTGATSYTPPPPPSTSTQQELDQQQQLKKSKKKRKSKWVSPILYTQRSCSITQRV